MKFSLSQLTNGYIITPPEFLSYIIGLSLVVSETYSK